MKTKIMLFNPPTMKNEYIGSDNYFPLGLLYLATVTKHNNMDVKIVDSNNYYYPNIADISETAFHEYVKCHILKGVDDYMPDIIGIGSIFSGAFRGLKIIAKTVKEKFPRIPIVIGGITATMFAREILRKYSYIDYVVIGEGETTFLKLVNYLVDKKCSLDSIDGLAFRDNRNIILNPKTKFIEELDALPFVDYGLLDINEYKMDTSGWYSPKKLKVGQPFPILSSRSCPQRCNFCNMRLVHGPKTRFRSPDNVLDEMEHLYNTYDVRYFQFMDDNLTFDRARIIEICEGIIRRNMNIQFDTPNGVAVSRLDQGVIDAMVAAGLVRISLAIESGSEYIRNEIMGKGLKTKKIYEIVEACAKHSHLWIKGFFVIGMPQETYETLEETYRMIKELPLDKFGVFFATPYPGTELFNYCLKHALLPYKIEDYVDIDDLQLGAVRPHFKPHKLTEDDLLVFQRKCYDYLKERRKSSALPINYPLRYKG